VGVGLGLATVVFTRKRLLSFTLSLGIVVAVMMVCYVAVPARLVGMKTTQSRRDKLTANAVVGAVGAIVCTPAYVLGCIVFAIGLILQAGATGTVKAIKMSTKLISGRRP
jgi:hypothetical protein